MHTPLKKSGRKRDVKLVAHSQNVEPTDHALTYGVTVTATSLVCSRDLSIDEWKALLRTAWQQGESTKWKLGDLWHYGKHRWGERKALVALRETIPGDNDSRIYARAYGTLLNYGYVAGRIESSRRHELLSWTHHYTVAKLEPDEQDRWLNLAEQNKLSVRQLERAMYDKGIFKPTDEDFERRTHKYYWQLIQAAKIPGHILSPWEDSAFEHYVANTLIHHSRCFAVERFEAAADFWSKTTQFVRQIDQEKASRVDLKQITKDEASSRTLHWLESVTCIRSVKPPWMNKHFEDYLLRTAHPAALRPLVRGLEETSTFFSNTAQFVRRIEKLRLENENPKTEPEV